MADGEEGARFDMASDSALLLDQAWTSTQYNTNRKSQLYQKIRADEIRLLRILRQPDPAGPGQEVRCSLQAYPRHSAPTYCALSYAWGYGWSDCGILINNDKFYVRRNLHRFLLHAARSKPEAIDYIWIDAISIDQDDLEERAAQVQHMASIYASARNVLIWLGPAYQNSHKALAYLEETAGKVTKHHDRIWGGQAGQAIAYLCGRQYWTRLWVLQELMLAKEIYIMCGDRFTPWSNLRDFLLILDQGGYSSRKYLPDYHNTRSSPAMSMVRQVVAGDQDRTMLKMLRQTQQLRCNQLRDKIFALLGLVVDRGDIKVDYTVSVPVLLNSVLREAYKKHKPRSLKEVVQHSQALEQWFELQSGAIFDLLNHDGSTYVAPRGKTSLAYGKMTYWWTIHYRHGQIQDLFFADKIITSDTVWHALKDNDTLTIKHILSAGRFDVNMKDDAGATMLHYAAFHGMASMADILLEMPHININCEDQLGRTPLCKALAYHASINADRGLQQDPGISSVMQVEYSLSISLLELLLAAKADVNRSVPESHTQLSLAIQTGDPKVVNLLLDAGAGVSSEGIGMPRYTSLGDQSLVQAVAVGNVEIAASLLKSGRFDPEAESTDGWTAMFIATSKGNVDFVKLFLDYGCRTKIVAFGRNNGWTILHMAAYHGHFALVEYLLADGRVDPNATAKDGKTAFLVAAEQRHRAIIELLHNYESNTAADNDKTVERQMIPIRPAMLDQSHASWTHLRPATGRPPDDPTFGGFSTDTSLDVITTNSVGRVSFEADTPPGSASNGVATESWQLPLNWDLSPSSIVW